MKEVRTCVCTPCISNRLTRRVDALAAFMGTAAPTKEVYEWKCRECGTTWEGGSWYEGESSRSAELVAPLRRRLLVRGLCGVDAGDAHVIDATAMQWDTAHEEQHAARNRVRELECVLSRLLDASKEEAQCHRLSWQGGVDIDRHRAAIDAVNACVREAETALCRRRPVA